MPDRTDASRPADNRVFELSIVMAGAVSGGAYQGGAMDFLIQAVDAWTRAKAEPDGAPDEDRVPVPDHDVVLRGFAGTSAGSYTAAIATVALRYDFPPVVDPQAEPGANPSEKSENPFFEAWVNRVDIDSLLQHRDFKTASRLPGRQVLSLLDCTAIDATVDDLLDMRAPDKRRAWVADPLAVRLTLGNLRGVPYGFALGHGSAITHEMTLHADNYDFAVQGRGAWPASLNAGYTPLLANNDRIRWGALGQSAKASAAFPFALRPRLVERPASDYRGREFLDPGDGLTFPKRAIAIPPLPTMPPDYAFMCMDGGIMNNEPLELGRTLLLTHLTDSNPRDGVNATRAVVMIDPFVDPADISHATEEVPLPALVMPLLNAWKAQCRFKPEDLAMAGQQDIFSRFIIAPKRSLPPRPPGRPEGEPPNPLASDGLGAFLGFFDRAFRVHDFQLGRRNTQQFLRRELAVPCDNVVVRSWWNRLTPQQQAKAKDLGWAFDGRDGVTYVPLVPLMPGVRDEIPECPWPEAPDPKSFHDPLGDRLDRVVGGLLVEFGSSFLMRLAIKGLWRFVYRSDVLDRIVDTLDKAFAAQWFARKP
ncbi:MAG: hypothetical protein NVV74_23305 [Magnetospirillum sp.]|nr:hypothetical protein [Magnetospirillum sp.]